MFVNALANEKCYNEFLKVVMVSYFVAEVLIRASNYSIENLISKIIPNQNMNKVILFLYPRF